MYEYAPYYTSRGSTQSKRKRRLLAPVDTHTPAAAEMLQQMGSVPSAVTDFVLHAGQEALECSGSGWIPRSDMRVALHAGKPFLLKLAGFRLIEASVNPMEFVKRCTALHAQGVPPNSLAILENAAGALIRLFAGYFVLCPYDAWRHKNLVKSALLGAYGSTWVSPREEELALMVTLFFEQSVVSHALTEIEGRLYVEGITCERVVNQRPYNLLVGLFERCQALLYPKVWANLPGPLAIQPLPLADALLPDVLHLLFGVHLRSVRGRLLLRGKPRRPEAWEWSVRVRYLAELLVPYLARQQNEQSQQPSQNPFGGPGSGNGQPGQNPQPVPGSLGFDPNAESHPFAGQGTGDSGSQAGGSPLPGSAPPGPPRFTDYEYIDRYYSERAQALVVRDQSEEAPEEKPRRITVGYLDYAPASVFDLVTGQIEWFRTRIGASDTGFPGNLQLYRRTEPLEMPLGGPEPESASLQHLMVVTDSSGSMVFNPAGEGAARGKYDVVLMACWGMFAFIQTHPKASDVQVNALNFSTDTTASGWHPCTNLEPAKRVLACYKGQNTTLSTSVLREAYAARPGPLLTVVITDGGLGNTQPALDAFKEIVADGNHVVLLHIGPANAFTQGIQELGCPVHLLNDASELVGLCLDLAKDRYNNDDARQA